MLVHEVEEEKHLQNTKAQGEVARANTEAAGSYPEELR